MFITYIFILVTALISIAAFNNRDLLNKLIMYPYGMSQPKEYYRLLTSGFIHADWMHLIFNMMTFYFFGLTVEIRCMEVCGSVIGGQVLYALIYLAAIVVSSIPALIKHKNHSYYMSLGASGGVSAILFFAIYYAPWNHIGFIFLPKGIPAIIFAILYSWYSAYMSKKGTDNIGHDAHLGGGIFGFTIAFFVDPSHGMNFLNSLLHPPALNTWIG